MFLKRIFDILFSFLGLLVLCPLFILIAVLIKKNDSGSIFFVQKRVGRSGKIFLIHKFRTMVMNAESLGDKITIGNDPRITSIGEILRKYKLDELPQLYDVLLGKMSLVGPRPEVPEYVDLYPDKARKVIFSVKPGITDWSSIIMIDENILLSNSEDPKLVYINQILPKKLAYAVTYVKARSIWVDFLIIVLTLKKIIIR